MDDEKTKQDKQDKRDKQDKQEQTMTEGQQSVPEQNERTEQTDQNERTETAQADQSEEIKALRGELMDLKLRLALLSGGASPEKLEEGVKLAAGIMTAEDGAPEKAAETVLREYPHIRLAKRSIPQLSAESRGCGDGFAAIRGIFAKR